MRRFIERYRFLVLVAVIAVIAVWGLSVMQRHGDMVSDAYYEQGNKYATMSGNSPFAIGGDNGTVYATALPHDNNRQFVINAIETTGFLPADVMQILAKNGNTVYTTLTEAFCGATTGYVRVANSSIAGSGNSYFVIDDGAGTVGWGEYRGKIGTVGTQFQVLANCSNFATQSATQTTGGEFALNGVTFPVGSRVYDMARIQTFNVGAAGISKDNNNGLVAIPKNSPVMAVIDYSGSSAGTSRFCITGAYM